MTDHDAAKAAPDPVAELASVYKALLALGPNVAALLTREDDRVELGKAAQAATAHAGQGDRAGCQAAIGDVEGASALVAKYATGSRRYPNAYAVAVGLRAALPRLRAIGWGGGSGAVLSVKTSFGTVTRHPDVDVGRTVTIARSGNTRGLLVVPLRVSGDAALAVVSGLPAGFLDGETEAQATLVFGRLVPGTARAGAAAPLAGRANIDPPVGTSLGAVPGFDFRVFDEQPPQKGTINFAEEIGQIARNPRQPVVRMVKVRRDGVSTALPAQGLVEVSGLPPGVVQAAPADFKAGSQYGEAPFTFAPSGTAERASAAAPMTGRADLRANDEFDPGDQASRTFTVVDGQPTPTPGKNPFRSRLAPGATPLPWLVDGLSMNWPDSGGADYQRIVGHYPVVSSGGSHNGGRTDSWTGIAGGPPSGDLAGGGAAGTQADFGGLGLGISFKIVKPGAGFVVATIESSPRNGRPTWEAMAQPGPWDAYHYALGRRMWAEVKKRGFNGWQFVSRFDKESNGGGYGLTAANAPAYGKALGRTIHFFDQGYMDGGADSPPLHVLGFARHDQLGPLEPIVPTFGGAIMVDAIDISMHPPATGLSILVGKPFADQVAGVRAWIRGDYDPRPCYAPDHKDPQYSALAVAKRLGILITNTETSPREDSNLACPIGAAAWQALHDFWSENADMVGAVGVYASTVLDKSLNVPGWAAAVDKYIELWGRKS